LGSLGSSRLIAVGWGLLGFWLMIAAGWQRGLALGFDHDAALDHGAIVTLVALLMLAGAAWLAVPVLVRRSSASAPLLAFVIAVGLVARLLQFGTEPLLEDDSYRYLWDGAVIAEGRNPYRHTPEQAFVNADIGLDGLARAHPVETSRVNHPWVRSPYPPVAQAAFGLAGSIAPFDLDVWRALLLTAELAALGLLVAVTRVLGRSGMWVALYWWNPLAVREFAAAAHMDALLMPLLAGALLLLIHARWRGAVLTLVVAAGVKIWPVLLVPLALFRGGGLRLAGTLALAVALAALVFWPMLETLLTPSSGIGAFAGHWRMNDAAFQWLAAVVELLGLPVQAARWWAAGIVAGLALVVAWRPPRSAEGWADRMLWVTAALFLLGPTGFPWYAMWMLPFLVLRPFPPLLWLSVLLPLYELRFIYEDLGNPWLFHRGLVWLEFAPVWLGLLWYALRYRRAARG